MFILSDIFETVMVICFGLSWPLSIMRSYKARTAKGKSLLFLSFIFIGYIFGIIAKVINGNISYVLVFYIVNSVMVFTDIVLWFRNHRIDNEASAG